MISRRGLLQRAGVASLAALTPRMAFAAERTDVVVIGAGLAGLNAASLLREQGMSVVVLEAADHVGGRMHTVSTVDGPLDVGASQIGRSYARVLDLCRRHRVPLVGEDRDLLTFGLNLEGHWIDDATWASNPLNLTVGEERAIAPMLLGSTLVARYNPLVALDDWLDPKFAQDDISLRQLLQRHGHSAQAIALAARFAPGISIDETSVIRMWQEDRRGAFDRTFASTPMTSTRVQPFGEVNDHKLAGGLPPASNIVGGCQQLPIAMAAALGDAVQLRKRVMRIDMDARGGTVGCADGSHYAARFIVAATPFTMLRDVAITGPSPGAAGKAIATMPYANTARLYLSADPFWLDDGLPPSFGTDGPLGMFWAIDNHKGTGAHRAMVVLTGTAAQHVTTDPAAAQAMLLGELARLRPASRGKVRVEAWKDWASDPLQKGCGFSLAPGQVNAFARDMIEPWGVLHFAGEHTRRIDFGMEAAAESGERAAIEIVARAA